MINLVTGPLGVGKTYYAIRKMTEAMRDGKMVATNVELYEDFDRRMARRSPAYYVRPFKKRQWLSPETGAKARFFYSPDLSDLMRLRLRGEGEGRGLMVLDESHDWMNARSWSDKRRGEIVKFFTRSRKLGWDILLLAQREQMVDSQVRNLFEYHIQLRNLKRARFGPLHLPFNLFLAIHTWHSTGQRVVLKREVYPLTWQRKLYNTMELVSGVVEADDQTIWLPSPPASRPPRAEDGALAPSEHATDARRTPHASHLALLDGLDPADADPSASLTAD